MTRYLVELKPNNIFDIMAMVALYRPGPMSFIPEYIKRRHNPKLVKYFDPRMKEYLEASYGIITYQDDVLYTAINIAGYNWKEADKLRKAIGKKIPEEMEKQHEKFVKGCIKKGMTEERAEELFSQIETFAAYGFNKAHAASYGMVAYWTAYVKAHFPVEYMSALMTAEATNTDKLMEAIGECEKLGIRVLPPDINESLTEFTVVSIKKEDQLKTGRAKNEGKAIRFGLNGIKNVGEAALEAILKARNKNPFQSFTHFIQAVNLQKVNKKVVESLIKAGALDRFGSRSTFLAHLPQARDIAIKLQKEKSTGQVGLFGSQKSEQEMIKDTFPEVTEMPLAEMLKYEKELLGVYLTDHPIKNLTKNIESQLTHKIISLSVNSAGQRVVLAGIIASVRLVNTKKNNSRMAFASLEDETCAVDLVIFPRLYKDTQELWQEDTPILITGRADDREDTLSVIVEEAKKLEPEKNNSSDKIFKITIPHNTPKPIMTKISDLLKSNPGNYQIIILIKNGKADKIINLPYKVAVSQKLKDKIGKLLSSK